MKSSFYILLFAAVTSQLTATAQVTNPLQEARGFDVITKNSFKLVQGHTDGPIAVGGNAILEGATTVAMNNSGAYPFAYNNANNYGMVVNGSVVYNSGGVSYINQGYLRIGTITGTTLFDVDNNNASTNLQAVKTGSGFNSSPRIQLQRQQPKSTVTTPHDIDFTTAFNQFIFNTDLIASYGTNTACSSSFNFITVPAGMNPRITLVNNKVNYLNLTQAQLQALNNQGSITFDVPPAANRMLIVNVVLSNGTFTWTPPNMAGIGDADAPYVLYNFSNATSLTIGNGNNSVYGTVYAPRADVYKTGGNNNNGQIVANSFTMAYGEVHSRPFKGTFPDCGVTTIINNYNNTRSGQPLPIKDIRLTATGNTYSNSLKWDVLQEQDVYNYAVEKSTDAKTFNIFTTVMAAGDALEQHYSTEDNNITADQTYYRIKVNFKNGTYMYSAVVKATGLAAAVSSTTVYPNPFQNVINIRSSQTGNIHIKLSDLSGRMVYEATMANKVGDVVNIPVNTNLQNGIYYLQVSDDQQNIILSKPLVKN